MKYFFIISIIFCCSVTFAQFSETQFAGGSTIGSQMGVDDTGQSVVGFGVNVRGLYAIDTKFSASGGITYFFPSMPENQSLVAWQINADGQYELYSNKKLKAYALGGLNYSIFKIKYEGMQNTLVNEEISNNKVGLDLGAGTKLDFGGFAEVKYDTAYEQLALTIGYYF
ncbi:MAG: outer membrane beta-barrel protein [Marinifilum sp.]|nr:outer membrane beta-barrel protein [Marinifilum sp.]